MFEKFLCTKPITWSFAALLLEYLRNSIHILYCPLQASKQKMLVTLSIGMDIDSIIEVKQPLGLEVSSCKICPDK